MGSSLHAVMAVVSLAVAAAPALAQSADPVALAPSQLRWDGQKKVERQLLHADPSCHVVTHRVRIAPRTDLPPHGHERGYRLVTVVSGDLQLGFGHKFDAQALKALPAGSIFSEPAGHQHFARTGAEPVVLQLTEYDAAAPLAGCTPAKVAK
ncbi:cupin domain-containing protein [Ottowia testudinis]|uniref:Cupin domain-containing protein n=1 Tax=Ottowia testudinis TaxID=2816950 RepID=A0A975CHA0_9BURK|nr:cupin domain-containing protein [Ottowia testudinis]QTD46370.1 cupin domain-containing protein [Ottowia testudinis]